MGEFDYKFFYDFAGKICEKLIDHAVIFLQIVLHWSPKTCDYIFIDKILVKLHTIMDLPCQKNSSPCCNFPHCYGY